VHPIDGIVDLDALVGDFHAEHERAYSVHAPGDTIEFVAWSVEAIGRTYTSEHSTPQVVSGKGKKSPASNRRTMDPKHGTIILGLHPSSGLRPGDEIDGPAVIEDRLTSIFIPEKSTATVTADGGMLLRL
jgi:N-methylhydantoinase A